MLLAGPKLPRLTAAGNDLLGSMAESGEDATKTLLNCDPGMTWHLRVAGPEASLVCLEGDVTLVHSRERQRIRTGDSVSLPRNAAVFIYGAMRARSLLRIVHLSGGQVRLLPIPIG